jgi:cell wall-associated NlpC family hydrolase
MPEIGAFGVVRTNGWAAWVIRYGTHSTVNHAFVYIGNGRIIEAQPGGAIESDATRYPAAIWSSMPLPDATRTKIAVWAQAQQGIGYGWADIAALALAVILRAVLPRKVATAILRVIARRIERMNRLICSQLADKAYALAGVHLFDDDRLPGEVTPGDLLRLIA